MTLVKPVKFTNPNPTLVTVGGIQAGSTFAGVNMQNMWEMLLYPYIAPGISLANSYSPSTIEFGSTITATTLTATLTAESNPITQVIFERQDNGGGYSAISTQAGPFGGTATYSNNPNTNLENDTPVSQVGTTQFQATAGDGTSVTISNTVTFNMVFPFYYGTGVMGITGNAIRSDLTLLVQVQQNYLATVSPNANYVYFAYPADYPDLIHIYDINGFDVLTSFTKTTPTITGLDTTTQNYKLYAYGPIGDGSSTTFNFEF